MSGAKPKSKKDKKKAREEGGTENPKSKTMATKPAEESLQIPETEVIVKNTVIGVMSNPKFSKAVGVTTGVNLAVITKAARDIKEGRAGEDTVTSLVQNIGGIVLGYLGAKEELAKKEAKR